MSCQFGKVNDLRKYLVGTQESNWTKVTKYLHRNWLRCCFSAENDSKIFLHDSPGHTQGSCFRCRYLRLDRNSSSPDIFTSVHDKKPPNIESIFLTFDQTFTYTVRVQRKSSSHFDSHHYTQQHSTWQIFT